MGTAETLTAMANDVVAFEVERDVVRASGPDTVSFLHGQLSQDVQGLAVGATAWTLLLQPQGKVEALLRLTRTAEDEVLLDTDAGWGARVVAALERFKLRTKVDLELLPWRAVALRGPKARAAAAAAPAGVVAVPFEWPGWHGVDLLGAAPAAPPEVEVGDPAAWEVARIVAGVPVMGADLTEKTIPQEAGVVDRTVSFTKGCYVGQELVARIDSRGHVNRHLRGLDVTGGVPGAGDEVRVARDGSPWTCGAVTSAAAAPGGRGVALGYVRREVEPGAEVEIVSAAGPLRAVVRALPMGPA